MKARTANDSTTPKIERVEGVRAIFSLVCVVNWRTGLKIRVRQPVDRGRSQDGVETRLESLTRANDSEPWARKEHPRRK